MNDVVSEEVGLKDVHVEVKNKNKRKLKPNEHLIRTDKNKLVIVEFSADGEETSKDDEMDIYVEMYEKYGNAVVEDNYKFCEDDDGFDEDKKKEIPIEKIPDDDSFDENETNIDLKNETVMN